ncbi:MAG: ATP-grasp domain-containing protein [Planctomycetaceae bacterium]|nr:ATP-grasp domain-containing protein [Planctomycetaceae bacterium]
MTTSLPPLLILGASTRAAAASAVRAGFAPVCADRFGDEDLRRIASVIAVDNDLHHTLDAIKKLPPTPWIYTGSLENDPKFIASVSERHPLLGNPREVLRKVRDPFWLERTLAAHDLPALKHRRTTDPPPTGGRWLLKPTRGGGGSRIAIWSGQTLPTTERVHFQELRPGTPMSALFVASPYEVELIGICEQLIGSTAGAPTEFGYAGSIGPIIVSDRTRELLQRLGDTLTREAQLRGLFGIDFILADDIPWLVELNPRYTASVEVLERVLGRPLLAEHASACGHRTATVRQWPAPNCIVGKRIVYATKDLTAPPLDYLFEADGHAPESPLIADIPASGSRIAKGWPICTVFAEENSLGECGVELASRCRAILDSMPS